MNNLEEVKKVAVEMSMVLTQEANELQINGEEDLRLAAGHKAQAKNEIKVIESAFKPTRITLSRPKSI